MKTPVDELTFNDRDEFKRKSVAEKVINLLISDIDVSPMVIDGGWGTGKTEFCHKLINHFNTEYDTHKIIYIDAFKADHADEPLLTVLAAVAELLPPDDQNKFIKSVTPLIKIGLKTSGKALFSHLLKQDIADVANDFDGILKTLADKVIDASVEAALRDHIKADKNLEALQNALRVVIKDQKPIIIFIDELDRCRPDFAVNMLEVIKHTFALDGLQFVLITNTVQLKAAVNHRYGNSIDAARYLNKFLKFRFALSSRINSRYDGSITSILHYENLIATNTALKAAKLDCDLYIELLRSVTEVKHISLREIEVLIRNLEIYMNITNGHYLNERFESGYRMLSFFAIMVYSFDVQLSDAFLRPNLDAKDIGTFFGEGKLIDYVEHGIRPKWHYYILVMLGENCKYNSEAFTPRGERQKLLWDRAVARIFTHGEFIGSEEAAKLVVANIEALSLCE